MHFLVSIVFLISSCQAAPHPTLTSTNISTKLLPSSTSPLVQLLATATSSENTDVTPIVFPLAAAQHIKRKPKKFRPKGESRFRPKSGRKAAVNLLPRSQKVERVKKSPFSGFSKRPRPSADNKIASSEVTNQNNHEAKVTTAQPSLVLQDYFGTPVPEDLPTQDNSDHFVAEPTFPIPFILSNDISSGQFVQSALFARLQSITGAQPVGVTREIAQPVGVPRHIAQPVGVLRDIAQPVGVPRDFAQPVGVTREIAQPVGVTREIAQHTQHNNDPQDSHMKQKGRKGLSSRKGVPQNIFPKEKEHKDKLSVVSRKDSARQLSDHPGRQASRRGSPNKNPQEQREQKVEVIYEDRKLNAVAAAASLPPRHKKTQKVKKRNLEKSFVGTLDRYQYENEDGSITWGYQNEDGGFKEETIGMDCITHGRYGYTDPSGKQREYGYTSGVRCDPHNRKVGVSDAGSDGSRGRNGNGFFDYTQNRFVMPDGRRVTVVVNQHNKARGRRY